MPRATKATPFTAWRRPLAATRLLLLVSVAAGIPSQSPAAGLLDLTLPRPSDAGELASRLVRLLGPPPTPLALKVAITNLWPAVPAVAGRINAEILVQNVGKEAIEIPASSNFASVMKAGNKDRRVLAGDLQLTHPQRAKPILMCIGIAVGSESVAGSMIRLAPQETLVIRGAETLGETMKWRQDGLDPQQVAVKAIVNEEFVEDERYATRTGRLTPYLATRRPSRGPGRANEGQMRNRLAPIFLGLAPGAGRRLRASPKIRGLRRRLNPR
jgi:hypothetical protein